MDFSLESETPQSSGYPEEMHLVGLNPPPDVQAQTLAKDTAQKVQEILSDEGDSKRGEKALAEIDIATGREFRLSNSSVVALTDPSKESQSYMSYDTTLRYALEQNGTYKDRAFLDAGFADYTEHQKDLSNLFELIPSAARPIADLVYNNDLAGAVTAYDQTVGSFLRRHPNDPQLFTGFLNGLNGQLEQFKVSNALKKEMNLGGQ